MLHTLKLVLSLSSQAMSWLFNKKLIQMSDDLHLAAAVDYIVKIFFLILNIQIEINKSTGLNMSLAKETDV